MNSSTDKQYQKKKQMTILQSLTLIEELKYIETSHSLLKEKKSTIEDGKKPNKCTFYQFLSC